MKSILMNEQKLATLASLLRYFSFYAIIHYLHFLPSIYILFSQSMINISICTWLSIRHRVWNYNYKTNMPHMCFHCKALKAILFKMSVFHISSLIFINHISLLNYQHISCSYLHTHIHTPITMTPTKKKGDDDEPQRKRNENCHLRFHWCEKIRIVFAWQENTSFLFELQI